MAERLKAPVSKTGVRAKRIVGSNPTLFAKLINPRVLYFIPLVSVFNAINN